MLCKYLTGFLITFSSAFMYININCFLVITIPMHVSINRLLLITFPMHVRL